MAFTRPAVMFIHPNVIESSQFSIQTSVSTDVPEAKVVHGDRYGDSTSGSVD